MEELKKINRFRRRLIIVQMKFIYIVVLATVSPVLAQQGDEPPPAQMAPEQLDQLVAPIALYPDPLLAQVLAASTFPTDIVDADRWVKQHANLKGQQLTDAVVKANLPYDPSIISLIQFPTVLDRLSKDLSWSTSLGNAFLTQRGDVMDAVQRMRRKAEKVGNLKSNEQVKVVSSQTAVEIQPANPQVIYVPNYNPQVVYVQPPPPPGPSAGAMVATGLISFGLGVAVGAASHNSCCWYGGSMAWSSRTVVVANTSFNRTWTTRAVVPRPAPYYRAGGPYPAGRAPIGGTYNRNVNVNVNNNTVNNVNRNTANVNRNTANVNRNTADANRNTANRNRADVNQGSADRIAADNSNRNHRGGGGQIEAGNRGYSRPAEGRSSAFSGAQNGRSEQSASRRGQASRGSRQR